MGCDTCKQKTNKNSEKDIVNDEYINLMPKSITNGNWGELGFLLKIVAFGVIAIAIPFIIVILTLQLFLHLFTPKFLVKIQNKLSTSFNKTLQKSAEHVARKRMEKRERQFANNSNYEVEEFGDLLVHENNEEYEEN